MLDQLRVQGRYVAECYGADGQLKWREEFDNLLTQIGKAFLMDEALAGSSYSATSYMGLIANTSFVGVSGGDTMTSHAGWIEAGNANAPTYSGSRPTNAWSAATVSGASAYSATKAFSAPNTYTFTGSGTIVGAFITIGSGASATIDNTGGTLYSAGAFGTSRTVVATDVVNVTYQTTIT